MKQSEKTEITIEKLLISAENEFAEKGLYGARIDAIADNAKVNKRMIYQHFGSKEGLYSAVLKHVYMRGAQIESSVFMQDMKNSDAIRCLVKEYFHFLKNDRNFVRIIMWENLNNAEYLKNSGAAETKTPFIKYIKKILDDGKEKGEFKKDISENQVMLSLIGGAFSYFSNIHTLSAILDYDMEKNENIEKRIKWVADALIKQISVCSTDG